MNKVKEQALPSYTHAPAPQTTKRNKRFWILAVLAGMLLFIANFRSVLRATSWKRRIGCGKGRFYTNPTSHYILPSGDKIPSVALGKSKMALYSIYWLDYLVLTCLPDRCLAGQQRRSWPSDQGSSSCRLPSHRRCLGLPRTYLNASAGSIPIEISEHRMSKRLEMPSRRVGFLGRTSLSPRRYAVFRDSVSQVTEPSRNSYGTRTMHRRISRQVWTNPYLASRHRTWTSTSFTGTYCTHPLPFPVSTLESQAGRVQEGTVRKRAGDRH